MTLTSTPRRAALREAVAARRRAKGSRGFPQDPFAPRRGPFVPSPDRENSMGNAPALVPGPLARLQDLQLLTELSAYHPQAGAPSRSSRRPRRRLLSLSNYASLFLFIWRVVWRAVWRGCNNKVLTVFSPRGPSVCHSIPSPPGVAAEVGRVIDSPAVASRRLSIRKIMAVNISTCCRLCSVELRSVWRYRRHFSGA